MSATSNMFQKLANKIINIVNICNKLNREYKPKNKINVDQKKDELMSEGNTNKQHKTN